MRIGSISPRQRDDILAAISELPFDLSDERANKKHRFWAEFMKQFTDDPRKAVEGKINETWLGFDVRAYIGNVISPLIAFGKPTTRNLGSLLYVEVSRQNGDLLVAATIPTKLGGSTEFICRASSEDYAAIVRMAVRTSF